MRNTAHLFFIVSENNSPTLEKHATHSLNIALFELDNVIYEWLHDENQTTSVKLKDFYSLC